MVGFPDSSQRQFWYPSRRVTSRQTVDFSVEPLSAAAFGDDVPVVRAGSPLLQLLAQGEQIKAGKQTDERGGIAIAMRVAFSLDLVDDESVGSDRAANAVIRIAGRQHRHLQQPGRPQHAPDLAEPVAEVAQRTVMDHIPRQDVNEADVGKRQGIGEALVQTHREAARRGGLAYHREPGRAAIDRLDIEAVLGEQPRMPADTATEIEHPPGTARVQFRQDRYYRRVRLEPIGAPFAGGPTLVPSLDRRLRHRT